MTSSEPLTAPLAPRQSDAVHQPDEQPPPPGRARWRLRDLDRPELIVAALLVLLLAVPFAMSAGRALRDDWVPSGDEAVIAVRVHDALTANRPLTGLPSTSDLYGGGIKTRHPGPIEFYVLAVPARILGPSAGLLLGAGAINLGSVLIALWVVLRRAGPGVALGASVLLALVIWSTGSAVLTDSISSNMGGYPLLCLAVLAWALACGDHRLLPLAAFVASFAGQQHLAVLLPVAIVAGWGLFGFVLTWNRELWLRRSLVLRWVGATALLVAVLWAPVVVDQVTGDPGNITAVARFARDSDRPTLGLSSGVTQVLRAAGLRPWVLRHDVRGFDVGAPLGLLGKAAGALVLLLAVALGALYYRQRPELSRLGITAVVVAVAGVLAGSSVPQSIEADRINLYRWTWALAFCVTLLIGWFVALLGRQVLRRGTVAQTDDELPRVVAHRVRLASMVGCVSLVAIIVTGSVATISPDDLRRDASVYGIDARLGDAAVAAAHENGAQPVVLVSSGGMAVLSVAPAIAARLADEGIRFQVPPQQADAYGDRRAFDPRTAASALVVVSSFGPLPDVPGELLAEAALNPDLEAPVDRLVAQARSGEVVPSAKAPALLDAMLPAIATVVRGRIERLASDPSPSLTTGETLQPLLDGYLASPTLDPAALRTMQRALGRTLTVWGDDRVAVYRMSIDQLRQFRPDLFG